MSTFAVSDQYGVLVSGEVSVCEVWPESFLVTYLDGFYRGTCVLVRFRPDAASVSRFRAEAVEATETDVARAQRMVGG